MDAKPYDGLDILGIAKEEIFQTAVNGLNAWKDNLSSGQGATGSRKPWVNTGEARDDIEMTPQTEGSLEYEVWGDVVQLWIAEFGRAPGKTPPPFKAISDWAHEKRISNRNAGKRMVLIKTKRDGVLEVGDEHAGIVRAMVKSIGAKGIRGFAPALKAAKDSTRDMDARVQARIEEELRVSEASSND